MLEKKIKVCVNATFNSAMLILTQIPKMYFSSVYYDFYRQRWIRMTVRFWISMPDGPDAIYIFMITAEILARSLANFHCQ